MFAKKRAISRNGLKNAHYEAFSTIVFANLLAGPYLTGFLLYLGFNASQIGMAMSIPLLMNSVVVVLSAYLMEKYTNRHKIIFITLLIHRILFLICGLIPFVVSKEWWVSVFMTLYMIICFFGSLSAAPFTTLLIDIIPNKMRAKYLGFRFTLTGIAASVTLLTAGWGLDRVKDSTGFALLYIVGSAVAIFNMVFISRYPNLPHVSTENGISLKYLLRPFRDSSFFKSIMFVSFWIMAQGGTISMFSFVMLDIIKVDYKWVGISNSLLAVVSIVAYSFWGRLNTRWSARKLLLWVFPTNAVSVILWGLQAFIPTTFMLVVVYTLLGISMAGFTLLVFNFVVSDAPEKDRSMYFAVYSSVTGLFGFIGSLLGGRLLNYINHWPLWFREYGLFVCIGLLMLLASLTVSVHIFNTISPQPDVNDKILEKGVMNITE